MASDRFTRTLLSMLLELKRVMHMRSDRRPSWFCWSTGICSNLRNLRWEHSDKYPGKGESLYLIPYFVSWPLFSGDTDFPIPHVNAIADPKYSKAQREYCIHDDLYDRRSKYCRMRYELIDYLIERVEAECALDSLT